MVTEPRTLCIHMAPTCCHNPAHKSGDAAQPSTEKQAHWREQIKAYIALHQPIKKRDLQQHFRRIPTPQLKAILSSLEDMGVVQNLAAGLSLVEGTGQ